MKRKLAILALILIAAYFIAQQDEQTKPPVSRTQTQGRSIPPAANDNKARKDFDFYVLSLSWSPSYCSRSGNQDNLQCGSAAQHGFVVHGLWPQNETGWPEFCPTSTDRVPARVVESMLDIMPSSGLVLHQWRKHGSCSGLTPARYFGLTRSALEKIHIPVEYERPYTAQMTQPDYIENRFKASNPALAHDMIHVTCTRSQIQEVRICMDKDLNFRACPNLEYRACNAASIEMPPIGSSAP